MVAPAVLGHPGAAASTGVSQQVGAKEKMSWALVLVAVFATIGGFLFGYDTGVVSGVTLFLQDDPKLSLSTVQIEQIISVTVGAAALGTALSGMPLQWYGRKPLIILAGVCFLLGSFFLALAEDFAELLIGRLLLGLGVGLSSIAVPVYLAELSPPSFRGKIVSCYGLSIVAGQAVACVVNIGCDRWLSYDYKWRVALGSAAIPSALMLCGFLCGLPESPKWLASQGRPEEARKVLVRLRGAGASSRQVEADWRALLALPVDDVGDVRALLGEVVRRPALQRAFGLGVGLQFLQQLSGINTLMYYGAPILVMCGFPQSASIELVR